MVEKDLSATHFRFGSRRSIFPRKHGVLASSERSASTAEAAHPYGLKAGSSRRIAIISILIALGVALSLYPGSIPVGPTRVFPFQHMINVIAGVVLGPLGASIVALGIGLLRNTLGTGTFFAYPGGIPGALVVGLVYHYLKRHDAAALTEPIGTAVGGLLSAAIVAPVIGARALPSFLGINTQWQLFVIFFWLSSIPGAILGFVLLLALRRRGILARLQI